MKQSSDFIGSDQLKTVDQRTPLQDASESHCETDEGAKECELTPVPKDIIEKAIYVPPSILRLKSLSISNCKPHAGYPGHSKSDSDIPSEEANDKSDVGHQQPQKMIDEEIFSSERSTCAKYLRDNFPAFGELADLRLKGWNNPEGEEYFSKQRYHTDNPDHKTTQTFLRMMTNVATKMQDATGVFSLPAHRPAILGFGFAPGGFIAKALEVNPDAHAQGITLSHKNKGIPVLIRDTRLETTYADITLMAGDMGLPTDAIPADHPEAKNFLGKLIRPRAQFDLVTGEGGVLRPHQQQLGSHRELREAQRLRAAQLALALSRVKHGGRMIVLLHKAEAWDNLCLFYTFDKFSNIRLFKPDKEHQHRSSFYMIATDIQSHSEEALAAVEQWKREWKVATFGTDEQCKEEARSNTLDVEKVLEEFGEKWIGLGKDVWNMQLEGLKQKSFTK